MLELSWYIVIKQWYALYILICSYDKVIPLEDVKEHFGFWKEIAKIDI